MKQPYRFICLLAMPFLVGCVVSNKKPVDYEQALQFRVAFPKAQLCLPDASVPFEIRNRTSSEISFSLAVGTWTEAISPDGQDCGVGVGGLPSPTHLGYLNVITIGPWQIYRGILEYALDGRCPAGTYNVTVEIAVKPPCYVPYYLDCIPEYCYLKSQEERIRVK